MSGQAVGSVLPTGERAPAKEKLSTKDMAIQIVRDAFGFGEARVYPLSTTHVLGEMRWRPFDDYVVRHGWERHASRLSALRDKEITTPFGKKVSFDQAAQFMKQMIEQTSDVDLKAWEQREFDDIQKRPVRGVFRPLMYLGRLQLKDSSFYPTPVLPDAWSEFRFPAFTPLYRIADVEIRDDARTANVGFPTLKRLSDPGQQLTASPVYLETVERASLWEERVTHLPKITLETVRAESPPVAVFDRAQSEGRPIDAVSKVIAFPAMKLVQPAYIQAELCVQGYAYGDLLTRLGQARAILDGKISELADGDDLVVRLDDGSVMGVDASAFDASVSSLENRAWMEKIEDRLGGRDAVLWNCVKYGARAEEVCSVGYVSNTVDPMRAILSGEPDTHLEGTVVELLRARSSPRTGETDFIRGISAFGHYTVEYTPGQYVIIGKMFSRGDTIHGSVVRRINALRQRESPVMESRYSSEAFKLMEDARVVQVCSGAYNHECFDRLCQWTASHWQIRHSVADVAGAAQILAVSDKERGSPMAKVTGQIEREGIEATLDYFK